MLWRASSKLLGACCANLMAAMVAEMLGRFMFIGSVGMALLGIILTILLPIGATIILFLLLKREIDFGDEEGIKR